MRYDVLDKLKDLVKRFDNNIDAYRSPLVSYNEHSCRTEYIDPLLKLLGWDVANERGLPPQYREVIAENYSSESDRPDYSLTLRGVTKFFVEAKKPSVRIAADRDAAQQTRRYGWNAKHRIAVLTNFEYLVIYDASIRPIEGDAASVARYKKYHYLQYVDCFDEIYKLLSKDSVFGGSFDEAFSDILFASDRNREPIDEVFLAQINEWRLAIGESLVAVDSSYRNEEKLNDAIQTLVNQIIFLRICEDKNLPTYHKLIEIAGDDDVCSDRLVEILKQADHTYNSGLFKNGDLAYVVEDRIIKNILKGLYYPNSPYLFEVIDPRLFGQIYEMFLAERVIVRENGSVALEKKADYQDRSVVATPLEVVRYIVEETLRPLCTGKSPAEILELRIADIACGSGLFLLEAYDFLVEHCLWWYLGNEPEHLIEIGDDDYKLPLEDKKTILTQCLYGVDVDIHAVEVSKLSLLIQLIKDETKPSIVGSDPILPDLSANIVFGNALIDSGHVRSVSLSESDIVSIAPFDWDQINGGAKFDAIIGNPPYVKTEDMHRLLTQAEVAIYKNVYDVSHKQFDKYFLFIERALSLVKADGFVCYVVPNKFFKTTSGEKLRRLISDRSLLVSLDDFGDIQLFDDKTIYCAVVKLQNSTHDAFMYASIDSPDRFWLGEDVDRVELPSALIRKDPWLLTTDLDFLDRLLDLEEESVPIGNHVDFFNGIQTSAERKRTYWFNYNEILDDRNGCIVFKRDGSIHSIEKSILRPFFKPTDEHGFNSYSDLCCDKWIIFPYDADGRLYSEETMIRRFPGAWGYLLGRKEELYPKQLVGGGHRDVPGATKGTWYQYGRSQSLTAFNNQEKLIIGVLSRQPLYYLDRNDWVIASGGTAGYCAAKMKPGSPYCLEYLVAWLTNRNTERILEMIGSDFEGGYYSRGTSLLSKLPFVELDLDDPVQRCRYDEVVNGVKRVYSLNGRIRCAASNQERTVLEREKKRKIEAVNDLVDAVYAGGF